MCYASESQEGYWTCDVVGGCAGCRRLARDIEDEDQLREWAEQRGRANK